MNNIAILASGSGSNAENIITFSKHHNKNAKFLLFTNNENAFVIERAKKLGVEIVIFTKEQLTNATIVQDALSKFNCDFIVLAGFLLLMPKSIVDLYQRRIINLHPSLLPLYGGKGMYGNRVHEAVLKNGETETGITIHFIDSKYDEGELIAQYKCSIEHCKSTADIEAEIHKLEYEHYPKVIFNILENKL